MQRRTLLATAGSISLALTAGCVETLQDHFEGEIQTPIPIEIEVDSDEQYSMNVRIEAYENGDSIGRQTYDEAYTVTADTRTSPPHLEGSDQYLRVIREDAELVEERIITSNTQFIAITLTDDEILLDVNYGDDESPENDSPINETAPDP